MRLSSAFFQTYRDIADEFDSISHRLLVRAGFIQQVAAGIYNFLPLGLRSINKIRQIINEEMIAVGGQEINMPLVQPAELWKQSGRFETFIPPLANFEDRRGQVMVLAPTHEETVSLMVRPLINSYRDLPQRLYQIQTKFRDEIRTRGGLLRTREFEMKDAYSFDADEAGLDAAFNDMEGAYHKIFARCGIDVIAVDADSGAIGGKESLEFVLPVDSGEDFILTCSSKSCDYAANREKADFKYPPEPEAEPGKLEKFATPNAKTINDLVRIAKVEARETAKAVFYQVGKEVVLVIVRGDRDVNESKLRRLLKADTLELATPEAAKAANLTPGYTSPVGIDDKIKVVVDELVTTTANLVGGANEIDYHYRNINYGRDYKAALVGKFVYGAAGDLCVVCNSPLEARRGIEVGHIFKLGTTYSEPMKINFQDANGKVQPTFMGCYGIGLGRLLAAAIERNHDDKGMTLPRSIAPYSVLLINLSAADAEIVRAADEIYAEISAAGIDILYDDRSATPGVKFTDAELVGIPVQIVIGKRVFAEGNVEVKERGSGEARLVPISDLVSAIKSDLSK